MSTPVSELPTNHGGLDWDKDACRSLSQSEPRSLSEHETKATSFIAIESQPTEARLDDAKLADRISPLAAFLATVQKPDHGKYFSSLCDDGVYRRLMYLPGPDDQFNGLEVYSAKPMSPELIKACLDRHPWNQAVEDRFRGIDGRTVPQEYVTPVYERHV